MRPTQYNKRLTIQTPTETTTGTGGKAVTYTDSYTCWANVKPVKGRKRLEYGRIEYNYIYEVEMRSRTTNPDTDNKVKYKDNLYAITTISIEDDIVQMDIAR